MNRELDREERTDRQGTLTDMQRVEGAMRAFARNFGAHTAMQFDACIHCGMCADACHFYIATENPEYTPIWKVEPFKQAYKREASAFAPFYRWLRLKKPLTAKELEHWQHLLFDSCTLCGRCSLICPMGIDVAGLIENGREAMFEAGLVPESIYRRAKQQAEGEDVGPLLEKLKSLASQNGLVAPIDLEKAEVMLAIGSGELASYPNHIVALMKVMSSMGVNYTFRSGNLLAGNYGYFAGSRDWQRIISARLVAEAQACGAKVVILPECGHCYTALRWQAAELLGRKLPFRVLNITEYLAEALDAGKLKLTQTSTLPITFHDPCEIVRKSGVTPEAPRKLMAAMGYEIREMTNHGGFAFCCGGGGGHPLISRATELRYRAIEPKLREVDETGTETVMTSCAGCRYSFDQAAKHYHWNKAPASLLETVADHLA